MKKNFSNTNPKISIKDIEALEKKLGFNLPQSYKDFLLVSNGGVPQENTFDVYSVSENKLLYSFVIREFLGIGVKEDIYKAFQYYKNELPNHYLPFAFDPFRNIMCLSVQTEEIYFWDCASRVANGQKFDPGALKIYYVCENFEDFLELLYSKKYI